MPQNVYDPGHSPVEPVPGDRMCPKCGAEMEPIETGAEGPPLQDLQLCPGCYLVVWRDQGGFQVRQGVPVKKDAHRAPN